MAKRGSNIELNHENWDQEDEPEEPGEFVPASQAALQSRVIKKAKRTITKTPEQAAGAFSAFAGFQTKSSAASASPLFSFLDSPKPIASNVLNGASHLPAPVSAVVPKMDKKPSEKDTSVPSSADDGTEQEVRSAEFYSKLKQLNDSVAKWISMHVSKSPCCILTPIFRDYEKYYAELEGSHPVIPTNRSSVETTKNKRTRTSAEELDKAVPNKKPSAEVKSSPAPLQFPVLSESPNKAPPFSFMSSDSVPPQDITKFSFGNAVSTPASSFGGFSFGTNGSNVTTALSTTGFTFAATSVSSQGTSNDDDTEEKEYEPPKPESSDIVEEDAFFTQRCKMFYRKDMVYVERGVGKLYLKKLGGKTQLLVRADTRLGNILLNIMLTTDIKTQRTGPNNVLICCIPYPPIDPKKPSVEPVPILIRVKTETEADQLLAKIDDSKS